MHHLPIVEGTPQVLSLVPGRLRVHLPAWSRNHPSELERRLRSFPGVEDVQASALTGNVLIHFDPSLSANRLLSELGSLPEGRATQTNGSSSATDGESRTAVVAEAVVKGTLGHAAVDAVFYTATAGGTALGWTWLAPVAAAHLVLDVFVWGMVLRPVAQHFQRTLAAPRPQGSS